MFIIELSPYHAPSISQVETVAAQVTGPVHRNPARPRRGPGPKSSGSQPLGPRGYDLLLAAAGRASARRPGEVQRIIHQLRFGSAEHDLSLAPERTPREGLVMCGDSSDYDDEDDIDCAFGLGAVAPALPDSFRVRFCLRVRLGRRAGRATSGHRTGRRAHRLRPHRRGGAASRPPRNGSPAARHRPELSGERRGDKRLSGAARKRGAAPRAHPGARVERTQ